MIGRENLVSGVLAATERVVQQVGAGDWQAALRTSEDRRALLEQLASQAPVEGEHGFLRALREAAAESDAALAAMKPREVDPPGAGRRLCMKA